MKTIETPTRLPANARKQQIIDEAVRASGTYGYLNVTRQMIADHLGIAPGLVSHYCGQMDELRDKIMREAVRRELLRIVAEGVINKHPVAQRARRELKARALASLTR